MSDTFHVLTSSLWAAFYQIYLIIKKTKKPPITNVWIKTWKYYNKLAFLTILGSQFVTQQAFTDQLNSSIPCTESPSGRRRIDGDSEWHKIFIPMFKDYSSLFYPHWKESLILIHFSPHRPVIRAWSNYHWDIQKPRMLLWPTAKQKL